MKFFTSVRLKIGLLIFALQCSPTFSAELLLKSELLTQVSLVQWNSGERTGTFRVTSTEDGLPKERVISPLDTNVFLYWGAPAPFARGQAGIVLNTGSIFVGTLSSFGEEKVLLSTEFLGDLEFPFENIAGIWMSTIPDSITRDQILLEMQSRNFPKDTMILRDGSRMEGVFGAGEDNTLIFETENGSAWGEKHWTPKDSEVAALVFSSRLRAPAEKQLAGVQYFRLGLADGSLILMPISDPAWGALMDEIPLEGITYLEAPPQSMNYIDTDLTAATEDAPRIRWLDELSPCRFAFDSSLGECGFPWSYGRNTSVSGTRLQTNGILFPHGFGVLPGMDLTFPLDGKFRRFVVFPALDDTTAPGTAARFRILADGKSCAEMEVRAGDVPRCVLVDVAGVRELRLLVENPDGTSPRQPPARGSWLRGVLIP